MKCPHCKMKMTKNFCAHCGYMTNGNFIDTKKKINIPLIELYFGKKYDEIIRNENWLVSSILGPIYILAHNHYIIGLLLVIADIAVSIFFHLLNIALALPFASIALTFLTFLYWLVNRIFWATISNMLYIRLLSKRLERCKEKHQTDYKMTIQDLYKKDNRILWIKYIVYATIFFLIYEMIKTNIDNIIFYR